ncbi:MAG: ribonuclease R [Methylocystaceae bacterium]
MNLTILNPDELLNHMRQESYRPLSYEELLDELSIPPEEVQNLSQLLGRLEKDGEIVKTRRGKYGLPEMMNLIRGTLSVTTRGYAFVTPDTGEGEDIFVYGRELNGAMHNDRVMVRLSRLAQGQSRAEGEVVRVIHRAHQELVGTYRKIRQVTQVVPDDRRLHTYPIFVHPGKKMPIKDGDKVVVKITTWPGKDGFADGSITEVLGGFQDPGVDVLSIIRKYQLRDSFAPEVETAAEQLAQPVSSEDLADRVDLRNLRMVTIDGEDARDLDDAVSINRLLDGGYELGVHIADVSHYVTEDSILDKEARERATSVYLVDRVLPMLPPVLSNGICSLNAGEPRLAYTCLMKIDAEGEVKEYSIVKSVIEVNERMTYSAVNKILQRSDPELLERYADYREDFDLMREVSGLIRQNRVKRGALDFDFPEAKVILDEEGRPVAIKKREHGVAESLIEDFMIAANETVARHIYDRTCPVLYRIHEKPAEEKINDLNQVLKVYGLNLPEHPEPKAVQTVLDYIKGRPDERIISTMILRSMRHARYSPLAIGHFGLASKYYCHFTSPIRRYPDLVVHRMLDLLAASGLPEKKRTQLAGKMQVLGDHCTVKEMAAEEAERDSVDMKKAEYMAPLVGRIFMGNISSVLSFGFFVELSNTVEGLVHISSISDDYYIFDDKAYTLYGKNRGTRYRIGDQVKIKLNNVNVSEAKIDFELYDGDEAPLDLDQITVEERVSTPQIHFVSELPEPLQAPRVHTAPRSQDKKSPAGRSKSKSKSTTRRRK